MIKIENLHVEVEGNKILKGVNLDVKAGETHAIMGPNGSGKSTLAYLLPRLYEPKSGSIKIDGLDIKQVPLEELRKNISIAFEESFLFSNTAEENIQARARGNILMALSNKFGWLVKFSSNKFPTHIGI